MIDIVTEIAENGAFTGNMEFDTCRHLCLLQQLIDGVVGGFSLTVIVQFQHDHTHRAVVSNQHAVIQRKVFYCLAQGRIMLSA